MILRVLVLVLLLTGTTLAAEPANLGEVEAKRCEERIAGVQRDALGRYEDALGELQTTMQKAADLEGALAVRSERQRVQRDRVLAEDVLVAEPKALRTLQSQTMGRIRELVAQLVQETLPRLLEQKRLLTIAGKLDEAVAVRVGIERLQNAHLPITHPDPNTAVLTDTLLQAYAADRVRADKQYRGQRILVRGVLAGHRADTVDPRQHLIFFAGTGGGWVQCALPVADYRVREEKQFNITSVVIVPKENEGAAVRVQRGQVLELRGICEGMDETVRVGKCELVR